jgi:hypothetical protein
MHRLLTFRNLLAAAAVLFAMGAAYSAMHTTQGLQGALNDTTLVAADYRGAIVDVEAILFSPAPLSMEDRILLSKAFQGMHRELERRGGTHLAHYGAREVMTLAGMSQGLGPLAGADLDRVRSNWMRVRSNTFGDESWYRFSEADPVAPREAAKIELSAADREALAGLRASLDRIEAAMQRGERDVDGLGEPDSEPSWADARGEAFAAAWKDWADGWRSDMESLRGDLPPAPAPESAAGVRFAHGAAVNAIEELAAIPSDGRGRWQTPLRHDWERRFQNAAKKVRDARFWIDRAERGLGV